MKEIYNEEQLVSAYKTAAAIPEAEWLTDLNGQCKPEVSPACINAAAQAALTATKRPQDWDAMVDRVRDCLLANELAVGETVLFVATEPYGGPGDFCLRGGVVQDIDHDRLTCSVRGSFFTMEDVPLHYVLGRYDKNAPGIHYGFQCVEPLFGEHPALADHYLREVEAQYNAHRSGEQEATPSMEL